MGRAKSIRLCWPPDGRSAGHRPQANPFQGLERRRCLTGMSRTRPATTTFSIAVSFPNRKSFSLTAIRVAKTAGLTGHKKRKMALDAIQAFQDRQGLVFTDLFVDGIKRTLGAVGHFSHRI